MASFQVFRDAVVQSTRSVELAKSQASWENVHPAYRSAAFRKMMLQYYKATSYVRLPRPSPWTPFLALDMCKLFRKVTDSDGLPRTTRLLMNANFVPFLVVRGVPLMKFGMLPFMVREHRQW